LRAKLWSICEPFAYSFEEQWGREVSKKSQG
jgi:hypothetical protein